MGVEHAEELAQDATEESSTSTETSSDTDAEAVKDEDSATSDTEDGQDGKEAETASVEPKKKATAEDRIKQLVAKQRESEREAAYWRGKAEGGKTPEPEQKVATAEDPEPNESQFQDYGAFVKAQARWEVRQELKGERARVVKASEEATKAEAEKSFAEKLRASADKHEDFREVVFAPTLTVNQHMLAIVQESEIGPDILYHLGKNPDEAARISRLSPLTAAREIGKLEAKLSAPPAKPPEPKRVTSAPPPVTTLSGNGTATVDPSKMSDDDWYKHYKAEKTKTIQAAQRR